MKKIAWIKMIAVSIVTSMFVTACSPAQEMEEVQTQETQNEMNGEMKEEMKEDMKEETQEMKKEIPVEEIAEQSMEMMSNSGEQVPEFEFVDMDGNLVNNESLKGQKVYMKYWASWCSICLAGLDEVDELFALDKDFTVYTIVTPNANGEMNQEEFTTWFNGLEQKNIKVLFDMKGQAASEFAVRAFPTSIFIGSDGVLIQTAPGHKSNDDIIKTVDSFY